jgi:hypothetical protein
MTTQLDKAMTLVKPGEIWSGNLNYPGYLIGSHGEVMSTIKRQARILSPIRLGNYVGYQMRDATGRLRKVYRHRIVAETFYGPCPSGMECRHLDGDPTNNDVLNLRWGTPRDNAADKAAHGTQTAGESCGTAKLTAEAVRSMRAERAANGTPYKAIAAAHGVTTMTAYRAITGQCWSTIS